MTSTPGTFGDWLIPDRIGLVDVSSACRDRDIAYQLPHRTSRRFADAKFHRDLLAAGSDLVGAVGRSYRRRAFIYWLAVRLLGGLAWRRAPTSE
jgi:hypothetical protein